MGLAKKKNSTLQLEPKSKTTFNLTTWEPYLPLKMWKTWKQSPTFYNSTSHQKLVHSFAMLESACNWACMRHDEPPSQEPLSLSRDKRPARLTWACPVGPSLAQTASRRSRRSWTPTQNDFREKFHFCKSTMILAASHHQVTSKACEADLSRSRKHQPGKGCT